MLPAAALFTGLRLGLGLAWFVIVVGEMTSVPQGLGAVIWTTARIAHQLVICGMIVIGVRLPLRPRGRADRQPAAALEPQPSWLTRRTHRRDRRVSVFQLQDQTIGACDASLSIRKGEFVCLIGASGCGKSTLLRIMAGFEQPSSGEALMWGRPIAEPDPSRGMVFQDYALFPWLSVRENIAFGPIARGLSLVSIVVGGVTFAFGEGGSKRLLAGIVFGVGMAIGAVNFMAWLFP